MKFYRVLLAVDLGLSPHKVISMLRGHMAQEISQTASRISPNNYAPEVVELDSGIQAMNARALENQRLQQNLLDGQEKVLLKGYDKNTWTYDIPFNFDGALNSLRHRKLSSEKSDGELLVPSTQTMDKTFGERHTSIDSRAPSPGPNPSNSDDAAMLHAPSAEGPMTRVPHVYTKAELAYIEQMAKNLESGQDFIYWGDDEFQWIEKDPFELTGIWGQIRVFSPDDDEGNRMLLYETGCCYCGGTSNEHWTTAQKLAGVITGIGTMSLSAFCMCSVANLRRLGQTTMTG